MSVIGKKTLKQLCRSCVPIRTRHNLYEFVLTWPSGQGQSGVMSACIYVCDLSKQSLPGVVETSVAVAIGCWLFSLQRHYPGISMALPWHFQGTSMALPWHFKGNSKARKNVIIRVLVLLSASVERVIVTHMRI